MGRSDATGMMTSLRGRRVSGLVATAVLITTLAVPTVGTSGPGTFERASVDSLGAQANGGSAASSISPSGDQVAFQSLATNLDTGDSNGTWDVFVRDHTPTGFYTALISRGLGGQSAAGPSRAPSIAGPGPLAFSNIAFESDAPNLVAGDTNGMTDVFLDGAGMMRVSVSSAGTQGNGPSSNASIQGEGLFVAFQSAAFNLVAGDTNGSIDVFVRDIAASTTKRVSISSAGLQALGGGYDPAISPDGRYVAFTSGSADLVAGDTNGAEDVFLHDRDADEDGIHDEAGAVSTERISVSTAGSEGNGDSGEPSVSIDGLAVAFTSNADDLVFNDINGVQDVFVRSRAGATTRRVSIATDGTQANGESRAPMIGATARFVMFESDASNLVPTDLNGATDVFRRDRNAGYTIRESELPTGDANGASRAPVVNVGGGIVAWDSDSTNLNDGLTPMVGGGDTNHVPDVIVHRTNVALVDDPCEDEEPPRELNGEVILPPDAEDIVVSDVNEVRGSVANLYPDHDTTDASWYEDIDCEWSIGGHVPEEAWDPDIDEELTKRGINVNMETLTDEIDLVGKDIQDWDSANRNTANMWGDLDPIGCPEDLAGVRPVYTPSPAPFPPVHPVSPELPREVSDALPDLPSLSVEAQAIADRLRMPKQPPARSAQSAAVRDPCDPLPPVDESEIDDDLVFGGRDIIFVHGYRTDPIFEKVANKPGAQAEWRKSRPGDKAAFLDDSGYWRAGAIGYWQDHINRWIDKPRARNRYLVVAWPSTQWLPYGVHASLTQISEAMHTGLNVVDPKGGTVGPGEFCRRKCVIVSHSAGGLNIDVGMTISMLTQFAGPFRWIFGDLSFIPERIKAHVAVQPALLGSTYATLLSALALVGAGAGPICQLAELVANDIFKGNITCAANLISILFGVTLDLATEITHHLWGGLVNSTPIPTLTVAGGHPTSLGADMPAGLKVPLALIARRLHLGIDDGVLTTNSQCANPASPAVRPAGYIARFTAIDEALNTAINGGTPPIVTGITPVMSKVYDMGIGTERAIYYYLDQAGDRYLQLRNPLISKTAYYTAAMCHSWLSPTGMVQPVLASYLAGPPGTGYFFSGSPSPTERFFNHHPFLQSASDHFWGPTLNSKAGHTNPTPLTLCYEETNPTSAACLGSPVDQDRDNWEESMGWYQNIGESSIYPDLVNPEFGRLPEERVEGKKIEFKRRILGVKIHFKWWVWKRTYHRLTNSESQTEMDYVYNYVLR